MHDTLFTVTVAVILDDMLNSEESILLALIAGLPRFTHDMLCTHSHPVIAKYMQCPTCLVFFAVVCLLLALVFCILCLCFSRVAIPIADSFDGSLNLPATETF